MADAVGSKLPAWPHYAADEVEAVAEVLRSGRVNQWTGPEVGAFEAAYAEHLGRAHAIAVANGTLALEAALVALELGSGDEVLVPARSFVATASCVVARGGRPRFVDVGASGQNVDVDTLEAARTPNTRAAIVAHIGGAMPDMEAIMAWARHHDLMVIEDCAQAHGAAWAGRPAGAWGDAAAFSFCQDKIISTGGEGGLLALDDEAAFRRAWAAKDHGKSYAAVFERDHPPGFRWYVETAGSNWRLTGMQAAIGLRQLGKLTKWRSVRAANAQILRSALQGLQGVELDPLPDQLTHAWYRCPIELTAPRYDAAARDRACAELTALGWWAQAGSCPEIYAEAFFRKLEFAPAAPLARASELGGRSLCFLVHPTIEPETMRDYAEAVRATLESL